MVTVFVYGTLMRGEERDLTRFGEVETLYQGEARVLHATLVVPRGAAFPALALFDEGGFPPNPGTLLSYAVGELWSISDAALVSLDTIEGARLDSTGQPVGMYRRIERAVQLPDGTGTMAFLYAWNRSLVGCTPIGVSWRAWRASLLSPVEVLTP